MTIEQLAEMGITEAESIAVYADLLKRSVARLESLRAMAVDTVAAPNQEKAKRDLLNCWREQADAVAIAVDLLDRGPVPAKDIAEEVYSILLKPGSLPEVCRERANNIAQAYAGRVAREPK